MATMDELTQQLQRLQDEVRVLRAQVAPPAPAEPRVLSRRNLLRAAPIAAIGGAVTAMSATPAAAAPPPAVLLGKDNDAGQALTSIESDVTFGGYVNMLSLTLKTDVEPLRHAGEPLLSILGRTIGPHPYGQDALVASSEDGATTISADAADGPVWGEGPDVVAYGTAVKATSHGGTSIAATTDTGQLFVGTSTSPTTPADAVSVTYSGTGHGVNVTSQNPDSSSSAVYAASAGHGPAVAGVGGPTGRGAQFSGGIAAARLVPSASTSHPWSGRVGDLMVDAASRLWFCNKTNTSTVPANWKQIA